MNAAGIAASLGERAEEVYRRYLPQGRKQGRYWVAGDLDGAKVSIGVQNWGIISDSHIRGCHAAAYGRKPR